MKEIGEAGQVPFEGTLYQNPCWIAPEAGLIPRVLGTPDGEDVGLPSKVWKESRELTLLPKPRG